MTSEPQPREQHVEVVRTARYWTLGAVERATHVWFVLHGYGQLARRFLRRFQGIAGPGRLIVAPEALSRFYAGHEPGRHGPGSIVGATWMTREDRRHEIEDYVRYLDRVAERVLDGPTPPASLTVLGFSQGVATAARWTVLGRLRPRRLVLWGDYLPPDLDLGRAREAWSRTEVILVRGDADPALGDPRLAAAETGRIRSAGLSVVRRAYAGGHDVEPDVLRAIADADDRAPTSADPDHSGTPANDT